MRMRLRHGIWFFASTLIFSLGCNWISGVTVDEKAPAPERSAGSGVASLGPDKESRIYYQFVDERGRVRFVERLQDVPERLRANAGFVEMSSPPPLTPADARATMTGRMKNTRETQAARPEVLLYYADWCGYCRKAKAHLNRRGVPYRIRDIDVSSVKKELVAKTGRSGVPVMDIDGRILQGYRGASYDDFLDEAGL
jgi:glutaredoxin